MRCLLSSPAVPLAILLNGQLFYLGAMTALGLRPSTYVTATCYVFIFLWAAIVLAHSRSVLRPSLCIIDALVAVFLLVLLSSLTWHRFDGWERLLAYLPFFVVLPYLCGRMLKTHQAVELAGVTLALGFLMYFIVVAWFTFASTADDYGARPELFGYNHTTLLAGLLFGSVAVLLAARLARPLQRPRGWLVNTMILMAMPPLFWMQQLVGARGGFIVASFVTVLFLMLARWVDISKRLAIICFLVMFVSLGFKMLPEKQVRFFSRMSSDLELQIMRVSPDLKLQIKRHKLAHDVCGEIEGFQEMGSSVAVRKLLYWNAANMALKYPLSGVGAGGYGNSLCGDSRYFPHSTLLQAFAELGLIGGLILVGIVGLVARGLAQCVFSGDRPERRNTAWMLMSLWGFYLMTDQLYGNYFLALPFSLLTGVAVAMLKNKDSNQPVALQAGV
jgi:hypothetical protein